ncbi:hypothetical protein DFJ74DRAFT_372452 [Hyaloraphidium curvatum]|nr:hypothetical protein DFJ74DRAFT_372452 [Hyaloraphidium curvatum]
MDCGGMTERGAAGAVAGDRRSGPRLVRRSEGRARRIVVGGSGPHPRASSPGSSSSSASGSPWGSASGSSGHSPDATTLAIRSGHSSPGPMDPIPITTAGEWLAWQTLLRLLWYQFMRDDAGFSHLVGAMPSAMGEFEPDLEFPVTAAVLASVTLPHDGPAASLPSSKLTAREVLGWMEFPDRGRRLAALTKLPEDRDMDCMQAMLLAVMCKLIRLEAWARSAGWAMVDLACAGPQSPLRLSRAARLREHLVSLIGDCILIMPPHIRKMVDADDIAGMIRYAVAQGRPMMSVVAPAGMHHLLHMMASAPQPLNPAPPAWYASPAFVSACSGAISISRFLRSGREHFADSDTSAQPYAVFYAAWIHVLAAREMLQSPELLSEAKGTVADAAICIEFLRVSGTAGWRHVAEALDAVESFLPGREAKGETVGVMAGRGDAQGAEEFMEMLEGGIRDMGIGVGS